MEKPWIKQFMFHSPRVLSILVIVFLIFQAGLAFNDQVYTFWQKILSFSIKLIPPVLMVIALAIAWKKEFQGGVIFIILGLAFIIISWKAAATIKLIFVGILLLFIGIVFLVNAKKSGE